MLQAKYFTTENTEPTEIFKGIFSVLSVRSVVNTSLAAIVAAAVCER